MKKINMKKLTHELMALALAVLGIVVLVLNLTKTCNVESIFAPIVAYGFLIGPAVTIAAIALFDDIRKTNYSKKGTR